LLAAAVTTAVGSSIFALEDDRESSTNMLLVLLADGLVFFVCLVSACLLMSEMFENIDLW
jgi:hypothetical protein